MIGVFDSGHGGLTVLRALLERFPAQGFIYLGDHGHAPYGNRPADEIVGLTRRACETLFGMVVDVPNDKRLQWLKKVEALGAKAG